MKKSPPVTITKTAFDKILEIRMHKNIPKEYSLRLGVKSAGCGIASHIIGFDHAVEKDETFELDGIDIIIEKIQLMYLAGKTIDYTESEGEVGFIFRDSN